MDSCHFWHETLAGSDLLFLYALEIIQEQESRVLFERLVVNQHDSWGLLLAFMDLIKELW
ncbi:hypothetical protein SADUNF_Sadunf01G0100800 [Salix dunnii]|uniref:CCR4-Not complex component Not1 C-terminal domain-containing protein n=1 Tax=Salix dunnii TaxID=1413687 RepID=A0A835TMY7_9ROSI|nr:hypothetical protein SADUNF_Sadunf01G0100800 [Salix dunnii]